MSDRDIEKCFGALVVFVVILLLLGGIVCREEYEYGVDRGRAEMKAWQDQWYAEHPVMPCAYAIYKTPYVAYKTDADGSANLYDVLSIGDCKNNPKPVVDVPPAPKPAPRKAKPIQGDWGKFGGTTLPHEAYCEDLASGVKWMPRPDGSCHSADMPQAEEPQ